MLLDSRTVSRKTPLDGKLEISAEAAAQLGARGTNVALVMDDRESTAGVSAMACTCGRGGGAGHIHHFLESPLFMALEEGQVVRIEWDEARSAVRVVAA